MKKKSVYLCATTIIVAGIAAITVNFTSCKKECSTCEVPSPDLVKSVTFNLVGKSMQEEFQIYQMNMKGGFYREHLSIYGKDNLLDFIKKYCLSKNIPVDNQTINVVLYYNSSVSQTFTVTDENIQGVSVYCLEKRKLMHHLFVRNEQSEFYEVENTKVSVPAVTTNHIHYYLENHVFNHPENKSYIIISGSLDVSENIKKYIKRTPIRFEVKTSAKRQQQTEEVTCFKPCAEGGAGTCTWEKGLHCEGYTPCFSIDMVSMLSGANIVESIFFDLDLMYAFRDDFLYESEKGENYVDNYYFLSEEYQNKVDIPLALQTALFFKDFNPVMDAFINPQNHLTEVVFTDDLTHSLLRLLDKYEKITTSSEGKAILNSVRSDVNSFKGKQLHDILALFN